MDALNRKRKYINTLCLIYVEALNKVFDHPHILIEYTVNRGIYTEIMGVENFSVGLLTKIKAEMDAIIADNLPVQRSLVPKIEAVDIFRVQGFEDKVKVIENSDVQEIPLVALSSRQYHFVGGVFDFTGEVSEFDIYTLQKGLVLVFPNSDSKGEIAYVNQEKLYHVFRESEEWARLMKVSYAGELNDFVKNGKLHEIVLISEALHEKKIAAIADEIDHRGNSRIILIAGPSSSGKTTFAKRLSIQLRVLGKSCFTLGLDDYFFDRDHMPLDAKGMKNPDSVQAVDLGLFSDNLRDLLDGKAVHLPKFDFITGKRTFSRKPVLLNEDALILVEGIHALNSQLTSLIDARSKFKIYISALTQLNIDHHNRIPTTDLRLIRRLVRDFHRRGYAPEDTVALWPSVVEGENQNIFPFQEDADVMFNSSLVYELAVLKKYALPLLSKVDDAHPSFPELARLIRFFEFFDECDDCLPYIPNTSILKEFIGGSCFRQ